MIAATEQAQPDYQRRIVDDELDELLHELPAMVLEGPKATGKTATALQRAGTVYRLDDPTQRLIAEADPRRLLVGDMPILIDEWQRLPTSWDLVRRAVDDGAAAGRFLLTGSATPVTDPVHSGAGRIATVRMRPLSFAERGLDAPTVSLAALLTGKRPSAGGPPDIAGATDVDLDVYVDEMVRSGFPGFRRQSHRAIRTRLDGYVARIIERDFEDLGRPIRNGPALRRWMRAYAAATSSTASFETIRNAATSGESNKPAKTTTIPYRDILERLWIIDEVPAWSHSRNLIRRLALSPKHQLADPALAARLLGLGTEALLEGREAGPPIPRNGTLLGHLFESLATLSVRVYAQAAEARVGHLRTAAGEHEVDLIVERADGRIVAIEVKLARSIGDDAVKHLSWLRREIGPDFLDGIVISTGPEAYRRADGFAVVPLALLGP